MAISGTLGGLTDLATRTGCSLDDILYALANERRRRLLAVLAPGETTLAEAAKDIATDERHHHGSRGEHYRRVYLDFYHVHVPELADVGLLEYDDETGIVSLTPAGVALSAEMPVGERTGAD